MGSQSKQCLSTGPPRDTHETPTREGKKAPMRVCGPGMVRSWSTREPPVSFTLSTLPPCLPDYPAGNQVRTLFFNQGNPGPSSRGNPRACPWR
jgi:hypothetical protein